jgi:hypothetical protein
MKRTTLTASLAGSAAAGLLAAALATPAFAQATTYPDGTDCSAIQNSANRTDCMSQQNESRQNATPGSGSGEVTPGAPAPNSQGSTSPNNSNAVNPGSSQNNNGQGPATGSGGSSGTNGAGTSQ